MIKCVISLKLIISLLPSHIFNAWQLLYSFTQVAFSVHVSALNMIK